MDRAATPVLHFVDEGARTRFVDALGATVVAVEPLANMLQGVPADIPDDVNIVTYVTVRNDDCVFCALTQLPDSHGMCHSAGRYNRWFSGNGAFKQVMSVDPTGVQARTQPSMHHDDCDYVWTVSRLYRYMGIREEHVADIIALTEAVATTRRPVDRVITRIRASDFLELLAAGDNTRRYPVPEPRDDKVELDERVTKRLKTELHKATDDYYACVACMEYDKGVVLLPCNHIAYCDACFKTMLEKTSVPKNCPLCREDVKDWISIKF